MATMPSSVIKPKVQMTATKAKPDCLDLEGDKEMPSSQLGIGNRFVSAVIQFARRNPCWTDHRNKLAAFLDL
jgi:hypothetical protein